MKYWFHAPRPHLSPRNGSQPSKMNPINLYFEADDDEAAVRYVKANISMNSNFKTGTLVEENPYRWITILIPEDADDYDNS